MRALTLEVRELTLDVRELPWRYGAPRAEVRRNRNAAIRHASKVRFRRRHATCSYRAAQVPEISRFYGIVIAMFFNEHGPPHFHAEYGGHRASVMIASREMHGELPGAARRLVLEWAALHERELLENWSRAREGRQLLPIAPLD